MYARNKMLPTLAALSLATTGALALLCAVACATTREPKAPATATAIQWRTFSDAIFQEAKAQHRLVLLDVGIEGCTACRHMYEVTYADPTVQKLINAHFIPVAVDADTEPDLGQRYVQWGWPATIFLTPDGQQVKAVQGNKLPNNFIPILREVLGEKAPKANAATPKLAKATAKVDLASSCGRWVARLDRNRAETSWGRGDIRLPRGPPPT